MFEVHVKCADDEGRECWDVYGPFKDRAEAEDFASEIDGAQVVETESK